MGVMKLCLLLFCLLLALPGVSSVRRLDDIDDFRSTNYVKHEPRHGLQLLFWFAQEVNVDQNSKEILLHFDLNNGTYGFHEFGNREGILPALESGQRYYEVGDLNSRIYRGVTALPFYVQMYYRNSDSHKRNMDRLIVSLDENRINRIHSVFITAHNQDLNNFNSDDTYEIDPALLSQIRRNYPCRNNEDEDVSQFLKDITYSLSCRSINRIKRSTDSSLPDSQCNTYKGIKLEIKTSTQGNTKLIWKNIPAGIMNKYKYVYIEILQNTHSSGNNEDPKQILLSH
ncbi:hypothetical protein H4Q32_004455 [Labeo rohita]|uniref:Uncharacterized protein n=1 Tax=Labeo rohita TaxID=84645 RepID=A0ABQ8N172_LABRO|nr:hypothetical protein H4Q32_004455 [Labeo rohita]